MCCGKWERMASKTTVRVTFFIEKRNNKRRSIMETMKVRQIGDEFENIFQDFKGKSLKRIYFRV
jgi:hypothetical protein